MKQIYRLLFCCLIFASLIGSIVCRTRQRNSNRRRQRLNAEASATSCLHKVPSADTKYVPVLNPGVPMEPRKRHPNGLLHIIDVMLIYTKAARISRGGKSMTMLADAAALVDKTNAVYKASKIPARLNLVYTRQASQEYFEANTISEDLNRITAGGDDYLDEVHNLRQCVGADLVILLTSTPATVTTNDRNVLGAAWFRTNSPAFDGTGFAPFAFAVVRYGASLNQTAVTFAHEIGHLAGCLHELESHSPSELSLMRKPYALGYSLRQEYRSVMSVKSGAKQIGFHSNPEILFEGTSSPLGNISYANAALFLSHEFSFLEAFVAGPTAEFCPAELIGCDDKPLSGLHLDRCGVCGGDDACVDCEDVTNGNKREDCLGVCGGSAVIDCLDVCNGAAKIDCSDVCNGGHIEDCAGVCGGLAILDCNLNCHGTAFVDDCGFCVSGKTDRIPNRDKDCLGICGGTAEVDECDVCDGDGSSCVAICDCPMPPDYWRTHNCFAPVPARRESWPGVYKDCTELVRCGGGSDEGEFGLLRWLDVLHAPTDRNNAWLTLAKHWISARLNLASSPCLAEVSKASRQKLINVMDSAQLLLETTTDPKACREAKITVLSGNSADGLSAMALTTVIGRFNERVEFSDLICQRTAMPDVKSERCEGGCTRITEYWNTHHSQAVSPSLRKAWPEHAETQQFCHGAGLQKLEILLVPEADAWTILAQQIIVTELNTASGACVPKEIADTILFSRSVLATQCGDGEAQHQQQDSMKKDMLGLASILEAYNRGELGPGECGTLTPLSNDPWAIAAASACEIGCVHSGAYWATHHLDAKREDLQKAWPLVDRNMGSDAAATEITSLCHQQPTEISWLSIMLMSSQGGGGDDAAAATIWLSLAQEWIAARLNTYSGACTTQSVLNGLLLATQILETNCENKLSKDEGGMEAALEIIHVLSEFNVGCGGRGPVKCAKEDSEMQFLVVSGLQAATRLARHEEECMEYTASECKSEKELSDKYLTWAVITTLLLAVFVAILLILLIWWWFQVRRAERRRTRRRSQRSTTNQTPNDEAQYNNNNNNTITSSYTTQAVRRQNANTNHISGWP